MEILPNYFHSEDYGLGIYAAMQFYRMKRRKNTIKAGWEDALPKYMKQKKIII